MDDLDWVDVVDRDDGVNWIEWAEVAREGESAGGGALGAGVETGRAAPLRRRPSGMTGMRGIEPAYLNLPFSQGSP